MAQQIREALAILRRKQVEARTGLSCSTIYQQMADGMFPKNVHIGVRAVGWLEAEIDGWLASRVEESRNPTTKAA